MGHFDCTHAKYSGPQDYTQGLLKSRLCHTCCRCDAPDPGLHLHRVLCCSSLSLIEMASIELEYVPAAFVGYLEYNCICRICGPTTYGQCFSYLTFVTALVPLMRDGYVDGIIGCASVRKRLFVGRKLKWLLQGAMIVKSLLCPPLTLMLYKMCITYRRR